MPSKHLIIFINKLFFSNLWKS